jgi:hypothetical protein
VQRTKRRCHGALNEFCRLHFILIKHVVTVGVETSLEYAAATEAVSIANRQVAERDERVESVRTIRTIGSRKAVVSVATGEEECGAERCHCIDFVVHFGSPVKGCCLIVER